MSETRRILFVAANPRKTAALQLEEEVRALEKCLRPGRLEVRPLFAAEWARIIRSYVADRPNIIHFSGHHTPELGIVLEKDGQPHPLDDTIIADLFRNNDAKPSPLLVFLNACNTKSLAERLREHVDCVICTRNVVRDATAVSFSQMFYQLLSEGASAQEAFDGSVNALREDVTNYPDVHVYCREFGKGIDPAKIHFAPRDPRPLRDAFIVQAVGDPGSETRARADHVFKRLVLRACARTGYRPVRAHEIDSPTVTEPIISALSTHTLVIADLGSGPCWNPNVMIELGFRLATAKPVVTLIDGQVDDSELPLHLRNLRHVAVDPSQPEKSVVDLISRIHRLESDTVTERAWTSGFPMIDFSFSTVLGGASQYIQANLCAARLYGCSHPDQLIGRSLDEMDKKLQSYMNRDIVKAFTDDQTRIINAILASFVSGKKIEVPSVRVPLWLANHPEPEFRARVFLPMVVNYKKDEREKTIVMRVAFVDISEWLARDCQMRTATEFFLPGLFRSKCHSDLFLCYDADDFDTAVQARQLLQRVGLRVWWADANYSANDDRFLKVRTLRDGLARSRIAVVVLGANGRGRWSRGDLDDALYTHCAANKPVMILRLPKCRSFDAENPLGERYQGQGHPLYVEWPEASGGACGIPDLDPASLVGRLLMVLAKVLQQNE
jgi:hypothetical protein